MSGRRHRNDLLWKKQGRGNGSCIYECDGKGNAVRDVIVNLCTNIGHMSKRNRGCYRRMEKCWVHNERGGLPSSDYQPVIE